MKLQASECPTNGLTRRFARTSGLALTGLRHISILPVMMTRHSTATTPAAYALIGWCGLVFLLAACSSKVIQYPEDHERFRRIDQAMEALREAYQKKDRSALHDLMLPLDQMERLQHEVEQDFDAYHSIVLEFKIERIMIEGDDVDIYVHWQGIWKKDADDNGLRQRGHGRLQWVGTHSILLRGAQGDLPFGMKTRQTYADAPAAPAKRP